MSFNSQGKPQRLHLCQLALSSVDGGVLNLDRWEELTCAHFLRKESAFLVLKTYRQDVWAHCAKRSLQL